MCSPPSPSLSSSRLACRAHSEFRDPGRSPSVRAVSPNSARGFSSRREMAFGEVIPLLLHPPRMFGHQLDGLADLLKEALRLIAMAGLLEQQRVAALRLLSGIIGGKRLVFDQGGVARALHLEASRIEEMPFSRAISRIGAAQPFKRYLRCGVVLPLELGEGETEHEVRVGRVEPGQELAVKADRLIGATGAQALRRQHGPVLGRARDLHLAKRLAIAALGVDHSDDAGG